MTTTSTTATLTTTLISGKVLATITDGSDVTTFSVKDGPRFLKAIDRKLGDLLWNRSGFNVDMTATLSRSVGYLALQKINARL